MELLTNVKRYNVANLFCEVQYIVCVSCKLKDFIQYVIGKVSSIILNIRDQKMFLIRNFGILTPNNLDDMYEQLNEILHKLVDLFPVPNHLIFIVLCMHLFNIFFHLLDLGFNHKGPLMNIFFIDIFNIFI
jgi:hypothetical protein